MVKWSISFPYFSGIARLQWGKVQGDSVRQLLSAIQQWAKDYNCTYHTADVMECSEEDFLIIKLTAPEAISFVYEK